MADIISPPGSITPEQEEQLRAYGQAMGEGVMNLGQTRDLMGAGSPWRIVLGALRGIQSRSALDTVERSRAGTRTRRSVFTPGVVSLDPGTQAPPSSIGGPPPGTVAPTSGSGVTAPGVRWGQPGQPVAIRFHNPGAIEYGAFARQFGARPGRDNPRYAQFDTPEQGFQAMHALLRNYMRRGRTTLSDIISRWAPAPENDVGAYVRRVAGTLGIDPASRLTEDDIPRLAIAMFGVESGANVAGMVTPVVASASAPAPQASASAGQLFTHTFTPGQPFSVVASASAPSSPQTPPSPEAVDTGAVGQFTPEGVPIRRVQTTPITDTGVGQPGYFAEGNIPPNVPRQIAVNPQLVALQQRLRDPTSMSRDEYNKALEEYQKLLAPVTVETTYGRATYNPLTGELQDFVPSGIIRRPVSGGGVSTEELLAPSATSSAGGFTVAPIAPPPVVPGTSGARTGGPRASASASGLPPSLQTTGLPDFPTGGDLGAIASWGMQAGAIRSMIDKMAETNTGQVSTAVQAADRASRRINELNTISALTDLSQGTRLTGTRLSELQTRIAQFLINFDPRSRDQRPDFLQHLGYRELLGKLNAFLASEATQDISARGTNFEFATLLQNNPNLSSSYEGTQMLLSYMRQEQEHIINLSRMARALPPSQYGNWGAIVDNYYRLNPITIEIPPSTNTRTGRTEPGRRISTARIPVPGETKHDGSGTWTEAEIRQHILDTIPPGTWFINPRTRQLALVPAPQSSPSTTPPTSPTPPLAPTPGAPRQ